MPNPSIATIPTSVASSNASVQLVAARRMRRGVAVYNDSTQILYLLCGDGVASSSNYTAQLAANGGYYETPFIYAGAVQGIWASANGNARVTEFV